MSDHTTSESEAVLVRYRCPHCEIIGDRYDPPCCVSPKPREKVRYVEIGALLEAAEYIEVWSTQWSVDPGDPGAGPMPSTSERSAHEIVRLAVQKLREQATDV